MRIFVDRTSRPFRYPSPGDEFTVPGVYCAANIEPSLQEYAIATKMNTEPQPTEVPYVRFLFVVENTGPARKATTIPRVYSGL